MARLSRPVGPRTGKSLPLWAILVLFLLGWCGRPASGHTESLDIEQVRSACCYEYWPRSLCIVVFVLLFGDSQPPCSASVVELGLRSPQGHATEAVLVEVAGNSRRLALSPVQSSPPPSFRNLAGAGCLSMELAGSSAGSSSTAVKCSSYSRLFSAVMTLLSYLNSTSTKQPDIYERARMSECTLYQVCSSTTTRYQVSYTRLPVRQQAVPCFAQRWYHSLPFLFVLNPRGCFYLTWSGAIIPGTARQ